MLLKESPLTRAIRWPLLCTIFIIPGSTSNFLFLFPIVSYLFPPPGLICMASSVKLLWLMGSLKFFLLWVIVVVVVLFFPQPKTFSDHCWAMLSFPSLPNDCLPLPFKLHNHCWTLWIHSGTSNNSWAWGLASHGKKGWTGAETQLLGLPQTWPFLSVIWVISSGPFLSNWDENLPFYLSLSAPLVSKVYLYPFGFVTDSEGKDKVKLMEPV